MPKPTEGMKVEAQRGLDWREEFGRGGTRVGAVRARQIVACLLYTSDAADE